MKSRFFALLRMTAILLLVTRHSSLVTLSAQEPPPASSAPSVKSADAVPVDDEFMEMYSDYALLVQEIERINNATGTITIPQSLRSLRTRAQAKEKKMQAWIDAHKVLPGSKFDVQGKRFVAPVVQKSEVRSQKPEEKAKAGGPQ